MADNVSNDTLSWVQIVFIDPSGEFYRSYYIRFNNQNQIFTHFYSYKEVAFVGNQHIQGKTYQNVYKFVYTGVESFYNTLYYNEDGFLKFISSDYGFVLERAE